MGHLHKWSEHDLRVATDALRDGATYHAVATRYGVNVSGFRQLIRRRQLPVAARRRKPGTLTLPVSQTELAYLAGILDGEGSISYAKTPRRWVVAIYNTSQELIEWLASFGGLTYTRRSPGAFSTTLPQYGWVLNRRVDVEVLLTALLPYLRIKRQKAVEALAFVH